MIEASVAPRLQGRESWFEFWNVRVVLPEEGLWFHLIPHLSVRDGEASLTVLDGGNGSGEGAAASMEVGPHRLGREGFSLSWEAEGEESVFAAGEVAASGPSTTWRVSVEPLVGDGSPDDARVQAAEDSFALRRTPFVHRVPIMKGRAEGAITQGGREHRFDDGLVYLAHNYGPDFPPGWTWIHALAFDRDASLAFEAASMPGTDQALVRICSSDGARTLSTLGGDRVEVERRGDDYSVRARSKAGDLWVTGTARHGAPVPFAFERPCGGLYEVEESFDGEVSISVSGRPHKASMAALGSAVRRDAQG